MSKSHADILRDFRIPIAMPEYNPFRWGNWILQYEHNKGRHAPGYFCDDTQEWLVADEPFPTLREADTLRTWMSYVPMEIESHLPHLAFARGARTVAVCGLGLGFYPLQLALNGYADKIVIFEKDETILELFFRATYGQPQWSELRKRAKIVQADVLADNFSYDAEIDYLYVDIWPTLNDKRSLDDTRAVCKRLQPRRVGFWGQELEAVGFAAREKMPVELIDTPDFWGLFVDHVGLPMDIPAGVHFADRYGTLCKDATWQSVITSHAHAEIAVDSFVPLLKKMGIDLNDVAVLYIPEE